jgi:hypothetical protein
MYKIVSQKKETFPLLISGVAAMYTKSAVDNVTPSADEVLKQL